MNLRALSVNNPWGWALCAHLPNGEPFKTGENRTSALGAANIGIWTLIQVGLAKPDPAAVEDMKNLADAFDVRMPDWATKAAQWKTIDGKRIGAVVGAVRFKADVPATEITNAYDKIWVTPPPSQGPDRRRVWVVEESVLLPTPIVCKGSVRPLLFTVPHEVEMMARWALTAMGRKL